MNAALLPILLFCSQLSLQDVFDGLPHHPGWMSAAAAVDRAEGEREIARGAFDIHTEVKGQAAPLGSWRKGASTATIGQALPVWGRPSVELGYRYGEDFPGWSGERLTSSLGEIRAKASLALAKGLWIDPHRAALQQSEQSIEEANARLDEIRLKLAERATAAYWTWVAAGHITQVEEELLQAAEVRQRALERQAETGAIAEIILTENRRLVFSRRALLIEARQQWQSAAYELAYYFRDQNGDMIVASEDGLPRVEQNLVSEIPLREAEQLTNTRPEIRAIDALLEQYRVQQRLAENQMLPSIDTSVSLSQDLGDARQVGPDTTSNQTELYLGVSMRLPVQRRIAKGKSQQARARHQMLLQKRRQSQDRLLLRVRNSYQLVLAAERSVQLAAEARQAAEAVTEAERRRFAEGQSDLLAVNLREQATASETRKWIRAWAKLQQARMLYRLAAGVLTMS